MSKQVRGFVTCDTFINNNINVVSPLYELSDLGLTFSRNKQQYYSSLDTTFSLFVFKEIDTIGLAQFEVNNIINVVKEFVLFCTTVQLSEAQDRIITFMANYNAANSAYPVTNLNCTTLIEMEGLKGPGYMSFTVVGVDCSIWLNDANFRGFFPDYDIQIVYPVADFNSKVQNVIQMVDGLDTFKFTEFNTRVEQAKGQYPTTYVKILNIPYQIPGTSILKDCHFAFNQYGAQGNYDYVLKLKLYEALLALGMTSEYIETIFPSILKINEFFVTPRWNRFAIPTQIGQNGIMSQITKSFSEPFDLTTFVKVYTDNTYLRNNSYNVPYDYKNMLLVVTNGFYTEEDVQDFKQYYSDLITVTSTHPDFGRMSSRSQHLVTLLENMLEVADSDTSVQMFNKMLANSNYAFNMITRQGVWYLSIFFEKHQMYVIPKFEYNRLLAV
jgi:hypothetical protein